ncbi:MAG TPA: tetrahydrofolate dehydrogenase/cyclohydrolase catalytic domain-containing protein [Acidimicrobiales bacterium]|jgi:methylenetetrahydrofolate dehydrogenase (NADP+)/methenyltetrahydrofolate cyclohydrolase|nr:tetrahydrofolate dehydrogenase/cyclohydrolase catalytic domain-containing protein [Acidimicrobiales bacterium]
MAGAPVAEAALTQVADRVARLAADGVTVGLGTILVGSDPASANYIARKHEACARVGMASFHQEVAADAGQAGLSAAVARFNDDPGVDAFIVQNPVPEGFDFNAAMEAVDPAKDADGLHPVNLGKLALGAEAPLPCTPAGIQALLAHYRVEVEGRHVVIVGRGPTLGRPLSMLLTLKRPGANAAVTVVHTGVADLGAYTRQADIVIGAAGVPGIISADMVRPGAAVVGGGMVYEGRRVLSDVDESVGEVAGHVTPRIGGVGPTTVAMLLRNTVEAALARRRLT